MEDIVFMKMASYDEGYENGQIAALQQIYDMLTDPKLDEADIFEYINKRI